VEPVTSPHGFNKCASNIFTGPCGVISAGAHSSRDNFRRAMTHCISDLIQCMSNPYVLSPHPPPPHLTTFNSPIQHSVYLAAREQRKGTAGHSQEDYIAFQEARFEKDKQLLLSTRGLKPSKTPPPTSVLSPHPPPFVRESGLICQQSEGWIGVVSGGGLHKRPAFHIMQDLVYSCVEEIATSGQSSSNAPTECLHKVILEQFERDRLCAGHRRWQRMGGGDRRLPPR